MQKNYCVIGQDGRVVSWHETGNAAIDARDANDVHTLRFTSIVLTAGQYADAKSKGLVK